MSLRLNSSSLTYSICTLAAIMLQLVATEWQKLQMVGFAYTIIYHTVYFFKQKSITLAIIWLEIAKKRYNELCDNIYRGSLLYKADSVNIISNTCWGLVPFNFLINEFLNFDILSWFLYKIYSWLCLPAYNSVTKKSSKGKQT